MNLKLFIVYISILRNDIHEDFTKYSKPIKTFRINLKMQPLVPESDTDFLLPFQLYLTDLDPVL